MELSFFLAQALGLYFLIMSTVLIFKRNIISRLFSHLRRNRLTVYMIACIELAIGVSILAAHNIWSGWQIIITLIGVGLVLESLFYFIVPMKTVERVNKRFTKSPWYYVALISMLVLALVLIFKGYRVW